MGIGYLLVSTTTASGNIVVPDAAITITGVQTKETTTTKTDFEGRSERIPLQTLDKEVSLTYEPGKPNYSYVVTINKQGFNTVTIKDVDIFDGQVSYLPVNLVPLDFDAITARRNMQEATMPVATNDEPPLVAPSPTVRTPIIPNNITVHLGPPGSNDPNVTVPFIYYIKNVASSEVFPTWPEESLRANIYAIISLTLNRIYTEWYRSRGYDFDITNNTAFDHKFTPNGQIYDSISNIVDNIFNEYIVLEGHIEPLFAAYCDGKEITDCVGLKQWGTVDLANENKTATEIIRHYYGEDANIVSTNRIEDIVDSYPGRTLQLGSTGNDVYTMQRFLNRISINYPSIPNLRTNGIFDLRMEEAVRQFQTSFDLPVDGKIGKNTWYRIAYVYNSVRKLSELGQEGERLPSEDYRFRGTLKEGARGEEVAILQTMLNIVAEFYPTVPSQKIDSQFGNATLQSVMAYQKTFGINPDGVVGPYTWNHLARKARELLATIPVRDQLLQFQGHALKEGSKGTEVKVMQSYLNEIALNYPSMPQVVADGFFGKATTAQVKAFQALFGINPDGIMGPYTWNRMLDVYATVVNVVPYPGFPLKQGMQNQYVSILQVYLNDIAKTYPSIPVLIIDDFFGPATKNSVMAFQRQLGLPEDGIVGKQTWDKIIEVYLRTATTLNPAAILEQVMETVGIILRNSKVF